MVVFRTVLHDLYILLRWGVLGIVLIAILLLFLVERPSVPLYFAKGALAEQNITYGRLSGGLLSGFTLTDVNYQNQLKAKRVRLKVDIEELPRQILHIHDIALQGVEIDPIFLADLIDTNSSDANESNISLPFDQLIVDHANLTVHNIAYQEYLIHDANLTLNALNTDLKENYRGDILLKLNGNMGKVDLNSRVDNQKVDIAATLNGNKDFLTPLLKEQNITFPTPPKITLKAKGEVDGIVAYGLNTSQLDLVYNQEYRLHTQQLSFIGTYDIPQKRLDATLDTQLNGSIAKLKLLAKTKLNIEDINHTLLFDLKGDLTPKKAFAQSFLTEQNMTLLSSPKITFDTKGKIDGKVHYKLTSSHFGLIYDKKYQIETQYLNLVGEYNFPKNYLDTTLDTQMDGTVAKLKLLAKTQLDIDDINQSLAFDVTGNMTPQKAFVQSFLNDQNITLLTAPTLDLTTKGSLKEATFESKLTQLKAKQNEITFDVPSLTLNGSTQALKGDTQITLATLLNTTAGKGKIDATSKFNFNQLEETLTFDTQADIEGEAAFINQQLKEEPFSITSTPKVKLEAKGSLEEITAKVEVKTELKKGEIISPLTLNTTPITLNLKTNRIDGEVKLLSEAKSLNLNLYSRFQGDYTNPKVLQTHTQATIRHFNVFGINLESLVPLNFTVNNSTQGAKAKLDSAHINLLAQTTDYDYLHFKLKTDNLYPSKIVQLPPDMEEMKEKFIKVDLKGEATLSENLFDLQGLVESNKKFKAQLKAKNSKAGLNVDLTTKTLHATAKGNLEDKNLIATLETQSVKALQKELSTLYPFTIVEVNGVLKAKATLNGENIGASITSPKLAFEQGFNIEKIEINADYTPELLTLNRLNFTTTGFKDKSLNQSFYLNQKGLVYLGTKRDLLIDMHPNIKVTATGDENRLAATVQIDKLPLGHPNYGSSQLSTDIEYKKEGLKQYITGDITLKKLKLFYEAKFLDVDYDPDVVIMTKKDKLKKAKADDSFLRYTFMDLKIKAPNAKYKTPDVELKFDVNLKAQKAFGKEVDLLGKIEEIEGHVDQVPKRFAIKESNIVFKGGKTINPLLDIHAEYELPQVIIYITVGGDANRPKLTFSSEPSMPQKDILSYLFFGVSTASLAEGEGSLSREAELFILNQAARDFAIDFDLDRIFIKDDGTGEGYAIEAGKNITKHNMVIIESSKVGNSFILEHEFNKDIKLQVGQHQKEQPSQSIDLFFRKKFK